MSKIILISAIFMLLFVSGVVAEVCPRSMCDVLYGETCGGNNVRICVPVSSEGCEGVYKYETKEVCDYKCRSMTSTDAECYTQDEEKSQDMKNTFYGIFVPVIAFVALFSIFLLIYWFILKLRNRFNKDKKDENTVTNKFCASCGTKVKEDSKFCQSCGKKV